MTNSLTGGGAERAMNLLCNSLQDSGLDTFLWPVKDSSQDVIRIRTRLEEPIFPNELTKQNILSSIQKFRQRVEDIKPDVIILNCNLPEFLGVFIRGKQFKTVIVEHARHPWKSRKILGLAIRIIHKLKRTHFVRVSNHLDIWPNLSKNAPILPNMIYASNSKVGRFDYRCFQRLVFIGRMDHLKRPHWFVEICAATGLPGIAIGEGRLIKSIKHYSDQLDANINFLGFVQDPWQYITARDLVISTSISEGDGLVVLEAISRGIPILLSDIVDFRRFALPKAVYCVDAQEYIDKIRRCQQGNLSIFMDQNQINNLILERKPAKVTSKWLNYLENLLITD